MARQRLPKVLAKQEIKLLLQAPNRKCPTGLRNYCVMLLIYRGGLRVGEVCGLRQTQINWADGTVRIIGKGDKERVVPLDFDTLEALTQWKAVKPKGSKAFFSTLRGGSVSRQYIHAMLNRESEKMGIQHTHPHMLRHTYATELLDEGFSLRDIQQVLGHAHITTTQIYMHVNPVQLRSKIQQRRMSE
ncbi:MAG: Tyrosine recombinase XerD [Firmicutes bacterium]|nr:Tyrosine recombinase XerD [Bacillota bacterium]